LRGYEVVSAVSRDEAIERITVRGFRPDLILTDFDLGLGCCTGDLIVAEIAAHLGFKPRTILLTGASGARADRAQTFADRILIKPVDMDALVRAMEDALCMPS
jgi:CheY-like chemotaxis protein